MLRLFEAFINGEIVKKKKLAEEFSVSEKAIQRDIEDLRNYFFESSNKYDHSIIYSRNEQGYYLVSNLQARFSNQEIYALIKILLESRAFPYREMKQVINKLIELAQEPERKHIREMVRNEEFFYVALQHNEPLFQKIWELSQAIKHQKKVYIHYKRPQSPELIHRTLEPVGIIFSEYYFYLVAYIEGNDKEFPAVYRMDRIKQYDVLQQRFYVKEHSRFQEGEFRKKIQFMQAGKLLRVKFRFWGESIEAVIDRLPNAIVTYAEDYYLVEAQVFGKGLKMWILSQGPFIEVLEPKEFREEIISSLQNMSSIYNISMLTRGDSDEGRDTNE